MCPAGIAAATDMWRIFREFGCGRRHAELKNGSYAQQMSPIHATFIHGVNRYFCLLWIVNTASISSLFNCAEWKKTSRRTSTLSLFAWTRNDKTEFKNDIHISHINISSLFWFKQKWIWRKIWAVARMLPCLSVRKRTTLRCELWRKGPLFYFWFLVVVVVVSIIFHFTNATVSAKTTKSLDATVHQITFIKL